MVRVGENERQQAHQSHLQRLAQSHEQLREALYLAESSSLPWDRAWTDADNPEEPLLEVHTATIDYYEQVVPFSEKLSRPPTPGGSGGVTPLSPGDGNGQRQSTLWNERLYTAEVPAHTVTDGGQTETQSTGQHATPTATAAGGGYHQHMQQSHKQLSEVEIDDSPPDTQRVTITLDSLPVWRGWHRTYSKTARVPQQGIVTKKFRKRVVIPIAGAAEVYRQLNRCLEQLNLLAEIKDDRPFVDFSEGADNGV